MNVRLCIGAALLLAAVGSPFAQAAGDREKSVMAFQRIAQVMRSPRCMNCHTATDHPRQGDAMRHHDQLVMRGADDKGTAPMRCAACHQDANSAGGHVPGAPGWRLAPLSMNWERARGDRELCEGLLDRNRNGNRTAKGLVIHMLNDPLVQWAWTPGAGRAVPAIGREEFHALLRLWQSTGAACPPNH